MAIAANRRNPWVRNTSTDLRTPFAASLPTQQLPETRSKRSFLFDGQDLSCNVNTLEDNADVIHVQPDHDEVVLVLEGQCGFRVGDEIRRVKAGDLMFIPRDTVHGPIVDSGRVALLSIFAPFFDRTKTNIRWSRDAFDDGHARDLATSFEARLVTGD